MKRWIAAAAAVAASATLASAASASATSATSAGDQALAQYAAAWAKVNTYTCTITAHEVQDTRAQDRVYAMYFRKPSDARMDITGGDGKGSAAVWHGGDTVRGHQGGFFSFVKLNLNIHDPKATSIRGTTIADADFGALLVHVKTLAGATIDAKPDGASTDVSVAVADPSSDQNVTKELMVLGPGGLPIEYDQWQADTQVKHITYTDVKLNVDIPDSEYTL
jgi:outer membrane lipoprotein-sorting protein